MGGGYDNRWKEGGGGGVRGEFVVRGREGKEREGEREGGKW